MTDNLFYHTGIGPEKVLDQLYAESKIEENYYWSPAVPPVFRCDVSPSLRQFFKEFVNVPLADIGFLKTFPNSLYPTHKDAFRITALNMPMGEPNSDFITSAYDIDLLKGTARHFDVNYDMDKFTILNVMSHHSVENKSKDLYRIILSIGIKTHSYTEILQLHREGKLFNV